MRYAIDIPPADEPARREDAEPDRLAGSLAAGEADLVDEEEREEAVERFAGGAADDGDGDDGDEDGAASDGADPGEGVAELVSEGEELDRQLSAISQKTEVDAALEALKARMAEAPTPTTAPAKEREKISSAFDEK